MSSKNVNTHNYEKFEIFELGIALSPKIKLYFYPRLNRIFIGIFKSIIRIVPYYTLNIVISIEYDYEKIEVIMFHFENSGRLLEKISRLWCKDVSSYKSYTVSK